MLNQRLALAIVSALALVLPIASVARADPVIVPTAVAGVLQGQGTGLCIAQAISPSPAADFGNLNVGNYNGSLNTFMEAHKPDRVESVIRTLLDLSNNNSSGLQSSFGDFTNAVDTCKLGGCDFLVNDTTTAIGARARGYLNVTPDMVGKIIHFGLYTDDAVSLTFFGPSGAIHPVIIRPPQLGLPTWRVTNSVTFQQPGLYPLEILWAEIAEHAALEMSWLVDDAFVDFERPANQAPVVKLKGAGFQLFGPESFSQTLSGQPSFPDINACQQCERQFANIPGNHGCPSSYYCNDAALCAPCDSAIVCGPTCSPCGGSTPFCINVNEEFTCVACTEDAQCGEGCQCDPDLHECVCLECQKDGDCAVGSVCEANVCIPCLSSTECAGNSCNCCPRTPEGKQMVCAPISTDGTPMCVECQTDADCPGQKCDLVVGRCLDEIPKNESPTCCGDDCLTCPSDAPFCLPTHVGTACAACRNDIDCGDGKYCRTGLCEVCLEDRRCGPRCKSCGGDTPFCFGAQVAANGQCVRCLSSADCDGDPCNPSTHTCETSCQVSCGLDTPYCFGDRCVECYADTQCSCGGTCNLDTNTCTTSCKDNGDCLGTEHCQWTDTGQTRKCELGQMPDDIGCGSTLGSLCQGSSIGAPVNDPLPLGGAVALSSLLFLARRKRRSRASDPPGRPAGQPRSRDRSAS